MTQPMLSPRAARTRSALIAAGMELLVERPVDAIAIDEFVATASVSKGSFFNHFTDKRQFAGAIAKEIRVDVEQWVTRINRDVADPLERLAGGMVAAAAYAVANPQRTVVLARTVNGASFDEHPVNAGLQQDLRDAIAARQIVMPSERAAVLFWLGICQVIMVSIVDSRADKAAAHALLADMLQLGLRGFGAAPARIDEIIQPAMMRAKLALLDGEN